QARGAAGCGGIAFAFGSGGAFESRGLGHGVGSQKEVGRLSAVFGPQALQKLAGAQALHVQNAQAAVFDPNELFRLQHPQRLIHALP
ncbi:MAG: hypothetical protein RIT44_1451, partial [Pseudomonadota bacterium]